MLSFYLNQLETEEEKSKLERIFIEYGSFMKYSALGMLKNEYDAEEAVGKAIEKIIKHLNGIEEIPSHKTTSFIVIIIRNICLDMLDKQKRNRTYSFEDIEDECAVNPNAFENIDIEELVDVIKKLPPMYRDVISMKVSHEKKDKQIAKMLNISESAFRKRLQRARNVLEEILAEREEF